MVDKKMRICFIFNGFFYKVYFFNPRGICILLRCNIYIQIYKIHLITTGTVNINLLPRIGEDHPVRISSRINIGGIKNRCIQDEIVLSQILIGSQRYPYLGYILSVQQNGIGIG